MIILEYLKNNKNTVTNILLALCLIVYLICEPGVLFKLSIIVGALLGSILGTLIVILPIGIAILIVAKLFKKYY